MPGVGAGPTCRPRAPTRRFEPMPPRGAFKSNSSAIHHIRDTLLLRAMGAAEKRAASFHAVPDDHAAAMPATRRQLMNRAFEAVEIMRDSVHHNLQRLVVFVPATFARRPAMPIDVALRFFARPIFLPRILLVTLNHGHTLRRARAATIELIGERRLQVLRNARISGRIHHFTNSSSCLCAINPHSCACPRKRRIDSRPFSP
jgi:hypothetical protein